MSRCAGVSGPRTWFAVGLCAVLCASAGSALALPGNLPKFTPLRIVFVTSGTTDGNIGGLAGADGIVAAAAASPGSLVSGLPVTAILSVTGTLAQSRFVDNGEPIYNTAGQRVADNLSQMFAGGATTLANPAVFDQTGAANDGIVWTGTDGNGALAPTHCTNYTTNTNLQDGRIGTSNATDVQWVQFGTLNCVNPARLYGLTSVVVSTPAVAVPTLDQWSVAILALLIGMAAWSARRETDRRGRKGS